MFHNIHLRLAASRGIGALAAAANRAPVPFRRWTVRVLGCRMQAHTLDRYVALWLWRTGKLERFGVANLDRFCGAGMTGVDVGANVGFYTLQMARRVGAAGHVYAFEPDRGNLGSLEQNVQLNGYHDRVTCEGKALAGQTGEATLFLNPGHHGDHRIFAGKDRAGGDAIEAVRGDDYFSPGKVIDFIKIDVQGAEESVLRGMRRLLEENPRCALLLEINSAANMPPGSSPEAVLELLGSAGFAVAAVEGMPASADRLPAREDVLRELQHRPYVDVVALHRERKKEHPQTGFAMATAAKRRTGREEQGVEQRLRGSIQTVPSCGHYCHGVCGT